MISNIYKLVFCVNHYEFPSSLYSEWKEINKEYDIMVGGRGGATVVLAGTAAPLKKKKSFGGLNYIFNIIGVFL